MSILEENNSDSPPAVKIWAKINDDIAKNREKSMYNIYKTTSDNKLRQFSFKLLHRILVTKKELKRYGITNDDSCFECQESDFIEHIFLKCSSSLKLYDEISKWFIMEHNTNIFNPTLEQISLNVCHLPSDLVPRLNRKISLLLQHVRHYIYASKFLKRKLDLEEYISKLKVTWKINKAA